MTGDLLVQNAMMVLPDGIVEGDLRVANGVTLRLDEALALARVEQQWASRAGSVATQALGEARALWLGGLAAATRES